MLGKQSAQNSDLFRNTGELLAHYRFADLSPQTYENAKTEINGQQIKGYDRDVNQWSNQISLDRLSRYKDYRAMLQHGILKAAVNMIAADATTKDAINKQKIHIKCDDNLIVQELDFLFHNVLNLNSKLRGIIKGFTGKGNHPCEILVDHESPEKGILGLRTIPVDKYWRIETKSGKLKRFEEKDGFQVKQLDPAQVVDWQMRDESSDFLPYGEPLIEGARKAWKQLSLMEAALLIYRIERAPERRIFYIDVGNSTQVEAEVLADMAKGRFKKKKYYNADTGEVDEKYSPLETSEDFFMPLTTSAPNSRIDTIQGGMNLGEIDDLQLFKQNMMAPLTIPLSYMSDQFQPGVSKASLAQEDINYARTVETVQDVAVEGLYKLAYVHLMLKGYSITDLPSINIHLTPPSDISEILKLDVEDKKMTVAMNAINLGLPKKYAFTTYLRISDEQADELIAEGLKDQLLMGRVQQGEDPFNPPKDVEQEGVLVSHSKEDNNTMLEQFIITRELVGLQAFSNQRGNQ